MKYVIIFMYNTKYNTYTMRVRFVIVICIVVILRMVVEANVNRGLHAEYLRRRWMQRQPATFKIFHEPPAGVHAEYLRRYRRMQRQSATVKPLHELHVRKHRRQPTPRV